MDQPDPNQAFAWRCPGSHRAKNLKRKYNLTLQQYQDMYDLQEGKCFICADSRDVLHIDHCHSTNQVRKLLCDRCNTGLGQFRDSTDLLEKSISYLQMFQSAPTALAA